MEKILTPFEKECMHQCLKNNYAIYLEVYNSMLRDKWNPLLTAINIMMNDINERS